MIKNKGGRRYNPNVKMRILLVSFLFLVPFAHAGDLESKKRFVHNFVERYQSAIEKRMGHRLWVNLIESDRFHASVETDAMDSFYMEIHTRVLERMTERQLNFVLCHEIGHVLGEVTFADIPPEKNRYKLDGRAGVEGESDYFAGRCLRETVEFEAAVEAARDVFIMLKGGPIDPEKAVEQKADGIDPEWPSSECRLLSVIRGYRGEPRPACWYNP